RDFDSSIPQSVENIILKACAKNPRNRYENVRDMYNDLCNCLDDSMKDVEKVEYEYKEYEELKKVKDVEVKEEEEEEVKKVKKKEKSGNKLAWVIGIIIGILVIAGVTLILLLPKLTKIPEISVPDVSNLNLAQAEKKLREAGFIINEKEEEEYSDKIEEGKVIRTNPQANVVRKKGTSVTIYISMGTEKIKIEDYTGQNIYEVKGKLEQLGLKVSVESQNVDDVTLYEDKEDKIIDQNPKTGELYKNDQIILYYPNVVVYPDLTEYTLNDLQDFADKYELSLYIEEVETDSVAEGTIISQNRIKGTLIVRGAELNVKIAVAPKAVETPSEAPSNGETTE
ncbi:MAG: PASTA domain-containing protein, partial [Bacilli bacterium]|nr:PASTA domain-containing protein [Bacilli bacterium]